MVNNLSHHPVVNNLIKPSSGQSHAFSNSLGVSPGKAVELWMKHFQQLRYLQQLFEDGILTQQEFVEQKRSIIGALSKLS